MSAKGVDLEPGAYGEDIVTRGMDWTQKETPITVLSHAYSGVKDKTVLINFPGSIKAVTLCTGLILPISEHAKKMV